MAPEIRKVVVTGASSEIGLAVCRRLLRPGDEALLCCLRRDEGCRSLPAQTQAACQVIRADLADDRALAELCRAAAGADILVNGAAVTRSGLVAHLADEDLLAMLSVNATALVKLCRAVLPAMVARRRGCIVNLSSVAAQRGNRGQAAYAGTKGFVEAFSRSLAAECGPKGIRVNCVAPGAIEAGSLRELLASAGDEVRRASALGRLGTADEVAAAVAFLCSPEASFISGRTLAVDGAFSQGV